MKSRPLIFVQLNEVNFDIVRAYVERYDDMPSFKRLLTQFVSFETLGEPNYHHLEPWIQWVSAQTGRTFEGHGVFRLGDIARAPEDLVQVFETLEAKGFTVGAISPMNARNRLQRPAYFIPDPWTDTPSDGSGFSRRLSAMLRQTVNENAAGRVSRQSKFAITEALLRSFSVRRGIALLRAMLATRRAPWTKAVILDQLIHIVHRHLWRRHRPDVSFVFFNAGAHVQHHYLLNSEFARTETRNPEWYVPAVADPVRDMLRAYDRMLGDYLHGVGGSHRLIVATGLSQVPYDRVKYYYRLRDHAAFLGEAGIAFTRVQTRMTRDFEIECADASAAQGVLQGLQRMCMERDGQPLFRECELRDRHVFATLTYPDEIRPDDAALLDGRRLAGFGRAVDFVAIKNGMHNARGFVFVSPELGRLPIPAEPVHVSALFDLTLGAAALRSVA